MKYRLTRDDGVEIDVPGGLWESVLERAYLNGWKPSGTGAPWDPTGRSARTTIADSPPRRGGRWPQSDYFSACSQYVYAEDALELGSAVIRGGSHAPVETGANDSREDAGIRRVAAFARIGGFVIGRAPERSRPA
jgi:hypothetical protein